MRKEKKSVVGKLGRTPCLGASGARFSERHRILISHSSDHQPQPHFLIEIHHIHCEIWNRATDIVRRTARDGDLCGGWLPEPGEWEVARV